MALHEVVWCFGQSLAAVFRFLSWRFGELCVAVSACVSIIWLLRVTAFALRQELAALVRALIV